MGKNTSGIFRKDIILYRQIVIHTAVIMRQSLTDLFVMACALRSYFQVSNFRFYAYEEDAYFELTFDKSLLLDALFEKVKPHRCILIPDNQCFIIKVYELEIEE